MPTTLASAIISKARILLQDSGAVRYSDSELLGWLNDGQREAATLKLDVYTKISNVTLVPGTRQSCPSDAVQFLDALRNMGASSNRSY